MVPNIIAKDGITDRVAEVLVLPLLWAAMSPEMENIMWMPTGNHIWNAYGLIMTLEEGVNPAQKRLQFVSGQNPQVHITLHPHRQVHRGADSWNSLNQLRACEDQWVDPSCLILKRTALLFLPAFSFLFFVTFSTGWIVFGSKNQGWVIFYFSIYSVPFNRNRWNE